MKYELTVFDHVKEIDLLHLKSCTRIFYVKEITPIFIATVGFRINKGLTFDTAVGLTVILNFWTYMLSLSAICLLMLFSNVEDLTA